MSVTPRILITRTGEGGRQLADGLRSQGLTVLHYAPVRLGGVDEPDAVRRQLVDCLPIEALIAPSAEALRQLVKLLPPNALGRPLIVVPGPGTAAVARQLGFARLCFPDREGNSERILEMPELARVEGWKIVIAAAVDGRRLIEARLRERGAEVCRLALYRRIPVPPAPELVEQLQDGSPIMTVLASGGALAGLQQQLPDRCWQALSAQPMIAPSIRVAELAEGAGCTRVFNAGGADDRTMVDALRMCCPTLPAIRYP